MISTSTQTYLTTAQAAELLNLSARTLERMRIDGSGPPFLKAGGGKRSRVIYAVADIQAWLSGQRFASTSEYPR
jgi:excisionase family DNA binding protein